MAKIGERIRQLRKSRQWTLLDLAKRVGVTQGYISQLERDLIGYQVETIENIAEAFSVSPTLLQDPGVDVEQLTQMSEILESIAKLSDEKREMVRQLLAALSDE